VRLVTSPLQMSLVTVTSASANKATEDYWNTFTGLPDDHVPEVPPDGVCLFFCVWLRVRVCVCVCVCRAHAH
jgi:hypothetical protein